MKQQSYKSNQFMSPEDEYEGKVVYKISDSPRSVYLQNEDKVKLNTISKEELSKKVEIDTLAQSDIALTISDIRADKTNTLRTLDVYKTNCNQ